MNRCRASYVLYCRMYRQQAKSRCATTLSDVLDGTLDVLMRCGDSVIEIAALNARTTAVNILTGDALALEAPLALRNELWRDFKFRRSVAPKSARAWFARQAQAVKP